MLLFAVRRLSWMCVVLFVITALVFTIFFLTPAVDPAVALAGKNPDPATVQQIRKNFGLDRPVPVQYATMMERLFISRDLTSYSNQGQRVVPRIVAGMPVTLSLAAGAIVIWLLASFIFAVLGAVFRGRLVDHVILIISLVFVSVPVYWLGQMANLVTQERFHHSLAFSWVPPPGYALMSSGLWNWASHLIVPWCVLAAFYVGWYARVLRANLIETDSEQFIRTARSKGIPEWRVMLHHNLRTSLLTYVSLFGLDLGLLLGGGALLVEVVFGLPGVGMLTYQALTGLDLPTIMATVTYAAVVVVVASALVDLSYAWLDPRIRLR
ncbi:MAG: peptide/nickel transport system permease protein [Gaiellales bacterium]|nr:peptide/nickel transport system permease protein [Gaiellales bacterium]